MRLNVLHRHGTDNGGILRHHAKVPLSRTARSHSFARQLAGLFHPSRHLHLVEMVVLVDVEVAHFLLLGLAGGEWSQRRAAEESHLDVLREAMEAEEPGRLSVWVLDAIEGRVPLHGLAHAGYGAHDEGVQAAPD